MCKILDAIKFNTCLEAGCAQPYLLLELRKYGARLAGCDISETQINENKQRYPDIDFFYFDLSGKKDTAVAVKKYDMVICSEVIEHIDDYKTAIENLCSLSDRYLLLTVPAGKVYQSDISVGHFRHFTEKMLEEELALHGFETVMSKRWGFPMQSLYRFLINLVGSDTINDAFLNKEYGFFKKVFCNMLYAIFFINDLFHRGNQIILLAKNKRAS